MVEVTLFLINSQVYTVYDYTKAAVRLGYEQSGVNKPVRILSFHLLNVIFNSSQVCEYAVTQIFDYYSREYAYNFTNKSAAQWKRMKKQ